MKYLSLPVYLIEFWYPEGVAFFFLLWKNLMLFLEEDLAVGLMWRLMFTPLFHDSSIVGRVLSFLFRFSRILVGLFAFVVSSILVFALAVYFLTLPLFALFDVPQNISRVLFLAGVGLFLLHRFTRPHQKVWQIGAKDLWLASEVKKDDLSLRKLLKSPQVIELLSTLEVQLNNLPVFEITNKDQIAQAAFELAKKTDSQYIGPRHFFVAALNDFPNIDNILLKLDLRLEDFEGALIYLETKKQLWRRFYLWDEEFSVHHLKGVNRGWLGVPTPNLDLISEDLTKKAAQGEYANFTFIRSGDILENVVNILSQQTGRNVLVVAQPGAGKSALIRHLAKQIVVGDAPLALATKRLVLLDLTKLLSGMQTQGNLADRVKTVFEEVEFAQNVIIVIEEIHELGLGEVGSSMNLYSLLQPYLESDTFQFIGTTESENYTHILEKNGPFARLFRKIELPAAGASDTLKILQLRSIEAERNSKITVSFIALKTILELSQKLIRDRVLPDSAMSVFKEALAQPANGWVTKELVKKVVSSRVKIPLVDVGTADTARFLNLEDEIHQNFINQEQAVGVIANTLRRSVTNLRDEDRPIGSFLFVGPTGVGKTELAKTLSEVYFKTEGAFVRFDMSEYQNPEAVVRLIGGAGVDGELTESIRNRPYALILLDEFEKANPKILTLFLQVLEDGRLTDYSGKVVDFSHTIIIATSNAGSLNIVKGLEQGQNWESIDKQVSEAILSVFSPELINRFDDIVVFKPLLPVDLEKIVNLKMAALQKSLSHKGYLVQFSGELLAQLAQKGFDPILGARPLRRLIQDRVEANFSKLILSGKVTKGETFQAGVELLG